MIEPSVQKAENTAKSQMSDKKSGKTKTKKQIQAELKEAKKEVRSTNKQNKRLAESVVKAQESNRELRAKNQQLKGKKLEVDAQTAAVLKEFAQLIRSAEFFKNQATHRKYTDGGTAGATILADNAITSFATFFSKRTTYQQLVHPSTREAFGKISQWYNHK